MARKTRLDRATGTWVPVEPAPAPAPTLSTDLGERRAQIAAMSPDERHADVERRRAEYEASLPSPPLGWRIRAFLWWMTARAAVAMWIRRHVLLMPDANYAQIETSQLDLALQVQGTARMIHEVRTRLVFHEQHIQMLGESRRRYDAQTKLRELERRETKRPEGQPA